LVYRNLSVLRRNICLFAKLRIVGLILLEDKLETW